MIQLARLFVSSVFGGRLEDRQRIAEAGRLMGYEVSLTEELVGANRSVREVIEKELRGCDTYVGLFGERRGTLLETAGVPGARRRSIAEWEFALATKLGLPRLALYDADSTPTAEVQALVSRFKSGVYPVMFRGAAELSQAVTTALAWRRPRVVLNLWRGAGAPGATDVTAGRTTGVTAVGAAGGERAQVGAPPESIGTSGAEVSQESVGESGHRSGDAGPAQMWAQLRLGWLRPALCLPDVGPLPVEMRFWAGGAELFDLFLGADQPGRRLNEDGLRLLGSKVLELLPAPIQEALGQVMAISGRRQGFTLPLVIRTDLGEPLALPWELIHHPSCPQPVRRGLLEVVRQVHPSGPHDDPLRDPLPSRASREFALLGFVADPVEDQKEGARPGADGGLEQAHNLFVEREQEALYQALEPILGRGPNGEPPRGRVVLTDTGDVEELRAALARPDRPGILHLGCHGGLATRRVLEAGSAAGTGAGVGVAALAAASAAASNAESAAWGNDVGAGSTAAPSVTASAALSAPFGASPGSASGTAGTATDTPPAGPPAAALFLEDSEGRRREVFAEDLGAWTHQQGRSIELAVLSACFTSSSWAVKAQRGGRRSAAPRNASELVATTGSLTEGLLAHGIPRVLGMQTSVSDLGATRFARAFYGCLATGRDLTQALAAGRQALQTDNDLPQEWAIPSLWIERDFQPLAAPQYAQTNELVGVERPATPFKVAGVAYLRDGYVERREFTRRARAAWREARVLAIHGLGGIGKSTYAARLLQRREQQGWRVLILPPGRLLPGQLLDEVARLLDVARRADLPAEQSERAFEQALEQRLAQQPTAILLDNFEDNTDESGAVSGELSRAIARLADLLSLPVRDPDPTAPPPEPDTLPGGRLVLTTRYAPLWDPSVSISQRHLPLGELSRAEARKLKLERPGLRSLVRPADGVQGPASVALDRNRWEQILNTFGGHPKALTLLAEHLAADPSAPLDLIDEVSTAVAAVDAQLANPHQRHEQGRQLLVEKLIRAIPAEHQRTLQLLALAIDPLPSEPSDDAVTLLTNAGIPQPAQSIRWLRQRGLLAPSLSSQTGRSGHLVHRLVATQLANAQNPPLPPLPAAEAQAFHTNLATYYRQRTGPLQDFALCAHHHQAAGNRPTAFQAYTDWCANLANRHAYRAAIEVAHLADSNLGPPASPTEQVAWGLRQHHVFDSYTALGQIPPAEATLQSILRQIPPGPPPEFQFLFAGCALKSARLEASRGNPASAMAALDRAAAGFRSAKAPRESAIVLGNIARLKDQAGDVQGALALHQERLSIFDKLGDVRERAVTLGDIALLKAQAGDVQGALALHQEMLSTFDKLGDVSSRAVNLGDIARLKAKAGDVQGALALHQERLSIFDKLGDVRSRAVTLGDIARLKAKAGDVQGALALHQEMLSTFDKLGDVSSRAVTLGDIARLKAKAGDVQGALALHQELLSIFDKLGDVRSRAVTLGDIARLKAKAGDVQGAISMNADRLQIARQMNDLENIAGTQFDLAQMELQGEAKRETAESVLQRLRESFGILMQIGRVDGIYAVGSMLGSILVQIGRPEARQVMEAARGAAETLGWRAKVAELDGLIQRCGQQGGG